MGPLLLLGLEVFPATAARSPIGCQHGFWRGGQRRAMGQLLLELLPFLLVGLLLGWRWPALPAVMAPWLVRWGVPLSLAALLLRSRWSLTLLKAGLVGLLVPLLSLVVLLAIPRLRQLLSSPELMLGAAVGNTGYWGLPVALALLPPEAMATAAAYDVAGTLITWTLGPMVLLGFHRDSAKHLSSLFSSPALQGFLLALLASLSPWRSQMAEVFWWPARAVLLLALLLLGMRLGVTIQRGHLALSAGLPWALAFKLCVVPILVWTAGTVLHLPVTDRQALVLQGAAPTALSVFLLVEGEGWDGALASSLILCSTLLAMVTVPLWWALIR